MQIIAARGFVESLTAASKNQWIVAKIGVKQSNLLHCLSFEDNAHHPKSENYVIFLGLNVEFAGAEIHVLTGYFCCLWVNYACS